MRYIILVLLSIGFLQFSQAQIYEVGVFAGGSNFIGDVGATNYIAPKEAAIGILAKWNRSPRHSWRVSLTYADLVGLDRKSDDPRRQERNYTFDTYLLEVSAGMEFNFFDFNLHEMGVQYTPYLYTGITVAKHDNYYFNNGTYTSENNSSWAYGIPMILGIKTRISDHMVLGGEIGVRYTFSDELDGSVPDDKFRREVYSFGNVNSNDWYVFTGLTLTYTFGQRPCYCNF